MNFNARRKSTVTIAMVCLLLFAFAIIIYINYVFIRQPTVEVDKKVNADDAVEILRITNSDYYNVESIQLSDLNSFSKLLDLLVTFPKVKKNIYVSKVSLPDFGECYEVYYDVNYDNNYNKTIFTKYFLDENFNILRKKLLGKPIM